MKKNIILVFLALIFFHKHYAQENKKSADEIAQELSNPVSTLASMTFQGTYTGWDGNLENASSQHTSTLVFMPTIPFKLKKGSISVRPSFPVAAAPTINEMGNWENKKGLGDIGVMAMYGEMNENGFIWGAGPSMFFPTASNEYLGKGQFQLGPVALIGVVKKWGVLGVLWQHWWGVTGVDSNNTQVNTGTAQLFYWFPAGNGWQIGGSPIPTANYVNATDTEFSIPINLGFAKTVVLGSTPLKFTLQGQYYVTRPETIGPSWGIFFQVTPVISLPW